VLERLGDGVVAVVSPDTETKIQVAKCGLTVERGDRVDAGQGVGHTRNEAQMGRHNAGTESATERTHVRHT
jgi:hypothetical protein